MNELTLNLEEEKRKEEWGEIDALVLNFQAQFQEECTEVEKKYAQECGNILVAKFSPLFKKYIQLCKYSNVDWTDRETKEFIALFIDDYELKKALFRKKITATNRAEIYAKFNFVIETYGKADDEDILSDLNMCLLVLAKRYKNVGKNFCAYVYNAFRHEVARHIKRYIKNPLNIQYKNCEFEEWVNNGTTINNDFIYEDNYYESLTGLPDLTWINGQSCADIFNKLSIFQRKVLVKYYLEDWNDRQIAEYLGAHINTVNQKRRDAVDLLCKEAGINKADIKRSRKSGKKASLPTII